MQIPTLEFEAPAEARRKQVERPAPRVRRLVDARVSPLPLRALSDARIFLADRDRRVFEWPLAKEGRFHVHQTLDRCELQ